MNPPADPEAGYALESVVPGPVEDDSGSWEAGSSESITATHSRSVRPSTSAVDPGPVRAPGRRKRLAIAGGILGGGIAFALLGALVSIAIRPGSDASPDRRRDGADGTAPAAPGSAGTSGPAVASVGDAIGSAPGQESRIPVSEATRLHPGDWLFQPRVESAKVRGVAVEELARRADRATALVEVSVGKYPDSTTRTGTAFCVDAFGLFITTADVVQGVTEARRQIRMLFGDLLEPRSVAYPTIVGVDDDSNLASLRIDPDPARPLEALAPARSADVPTGAPVVILGFPQGRYQPIYDAKGQLVEGRSFHFNYAQPWNYEPPDHLIMPSRVKTVWREEAGLGALELEGEWLQFPSGSPALNAAGEVVGIIIRPDAPETFTVTVTRSRGRAILRSAGASAPVRGVIGAVHLVRFLEHARRPDDLAASGPDAGRLAVIARVKKATAMVEVSTRAGQASGTAFCVDRSGLFVTNAHVIEDTLTDSRYAVNLVVDSGLATQQIRRAEVVRVDRKVDLALLRIQADAPLQALELGADGDVGPTMQVTTFGFPFGKFIPPANRTHPEIATNVSRVTAVSPEVRFDGQLNPGNSGGPVVDSRGRVIGVARATILGASINFAIPVGPLREFLAAPGMLVRTHPVAFRDRARPTSWTIQVIPSQFAPLPQDLAVSVTIPDGANTPRQLWAEPAPAGPEGAFRLEFVPVPRDPGRGVALAIRFGDRVERAIVEDRELSIGGRTVPLRAIRHLVLRANPWAFVTDGAAKGPAADLGEAVRGPVVGLGRVTAVQEGERKPIDLGAAAELTLVDVEPARAPEVAAVIEVHKGGRTGPVMAGNRTRMALSDATAPTGASDEARPVGVPSRAPRPDGGLTILTRTMPQGPRTARRRPELEEGPVQLGGELDVAGVPSGAAGAIRPPRAAIGKARALDASQDAVGVRALDLSAPPENTRPTPMPIPGPPRDSATRLFAIAFSPDGSRLAIGLHEGIRVYDVASGRMIRELDQRNASQLAFSADRDELLAFSAPYQEFSVGMPRPGGPSAQPARGPLVWDVKTGLSARVPPIPGIEKNGPVEWISPDNPYVMTRGTGMKFWDVRTGALRLALDEDWRRPRAIKVRDGGSLNNPVVTADGKRALSFYARPRPEPPKAGTTTNKVPAPAGSNPDDPYIATRLQLHDIGSGRLLFEMDFAGMDFIGLIPGTDACVCEADGTVSVRNLKDGRELRRVLLRPASPLRNESTLVALQRRPGSPQLTADGKQLVEPIAGGGFALFDLASGAEVARFRSPETSAGGPLHTLLLAPSGRVAAVHFRRDVQLWTLPAPGSGTPAATVRKTEAPMVRELGGTATAVAVGGAGRYLLLTLANERRLAIFDINAADVVKTIPLDSGKALVAAGATRFVIADPESRRIERWDFRTLTRDGDPQPLPFPGTLKTIALGADSEGPLLTSWSFAASTGVKSDRYSFVDLASFRVLAVGLMALHGSDREAARLASTGGAFELRNRSAVDRVRLRASYDGTLFGISRSEADRAQDDFALKVDAGAVALSYDHDLQRAQNEPFYMIPGPDGRRIFHSTTGVRDAVFVEAPRAPGLQRPRNEDRPLRFPTTDARFDVSLRVADTITLLRAEDGSRVLAIGGLDEMTGAIQDGEVVRGGISLENRYHFVPAAHLLVTIPPTNDRLVLRRVDFDPVAGR